MSFWDKIVDDRIDIYTVVAESEVSSVLEPKPTTGHCVENVHEITITGEGDNYKNILYHIQSDEKTIIQ
jgi:hypothetical protein